MGGGRSPMIKLLAVALRQNYFTATTKFLVRYFFPFYQNDVWGVPYPWNAGVIDIPVRVVVSGGKSGGCQSAVRIAHSRRRAGVPPAPVETNQFLVFVCFVCILRIVNLRTSRIFTG